MARLSNNPRGLDRLVSIRATWKPIAEDGEPGELRGSINFSHEVIGRSEDSPITFKLELSSAELLVKRPPDTAFLDETVLQPKFTDQEIGQKTGGGGANVELGLQGVKLGAQSGETVETNKTVSTMLTASTQDGDGNPIFEFASAADGTLMGPGWNGFETIGRIKSLKPPKTYDPEPVLYVRAAGEGLKVVDPMLKKKKSQKGWNRSSNKRLVALAYLKKTLIEDYSLEVEGEISEKHSLATLVRYEPQTVQNS